MKPWTCNIAKVETENQVCIGYPSLAQIVQKVVMQLADRFFKTGLESLSDYECVELLFSLVLSHEEGRKQAKKCVGQFGSLRAIIETSLEELQQSGLAPPVILFIRLISQIPLRVLKQRITGIHVYESSQEVFDYLYYSMRGLKDEVFKVIYLNSRNQIIETLDLFYGTVNNITISVREIAENAIKYRAVFMIFAHNHPSGDPTPSKNDKQITRDLVFLGNVLQIRVLDHIIIGDNSHFSFNGEGLIEKYEDSFLTLRMKAGT